jgi:hypothetical protein
MNWGIYLVNIVYQLIYFVIERNQFSLQKFELKNRYNFIVQYENYYSPELLSSLLEYGQGEEKQ